MISIPTTVPPGENYKEFVEYASSLLKNLGLKTEVIKVPKSYIRQYLPGMEDYPRYLLLGKIGNGKPILHFNGHYDVVPAGSSWDYEPFNPAVVNNRIYGRGSSDMKGGMVSVITTLKALLSLDIELNGSLEISMTPDEEIGGMCGAKYLLEKIDVPN